MKSKHYTYAYNIIIMARVDSFDRVIEIDLDLDNSNVEMNNSNNSPPSSSDPSESGYELEEDNFSSTTVTMISTRLKQTAMKNCLHIL